MIGNIVVIILICQFLSVLRVLSESRADCPPAILLAGCSAYSSMTNIFILGLSYANSTLQHLESNQRLLAETMQDLKGSSELEVRAGYFGMCVRQSGVVWLCSSDYDGLARQIGYENDPLNLIGAAAKFKDDVLFSGLLFMVVILAAVSTVLLATFPGWHEEHDERTGSVVDVKPFPSRPVSQVALAAAAIAAMQLVIASLWQHVGAVGTAAMAESANYGNVVTDIGAAAMSMAWVGTVVETTIAIGLLVMILSIIVLDRLTDND